MASSSGCRRARLDRPVKHRFDSRDLCADNLRVEQFSAGLPESPELSCAGGVTSLGVAVRALRWILA